MKTVLVGALGAAAVAACPAWAAQSGASVSITDIRFEVVDLRPEDGIAAWAEFLPSTRLSSVGASVANLCGSGDAWCRFATSANALGPLGASISGRGASAEASLSASGILASFSGNPGDRPGVTKQVRAGAGITGDDYWNGLVRMSAHTALKMTARYSIEAWTEAETGSSRDTAAFAIIQLRSWQHNFSDSVLVNSEDGPGRDHSSGELTWLLENNRLVEHTVRGSLSATARGGIPAIPEPSTYALMAAGLGVVGVVARRRRKEG